VKGESTGGGVDVRPVPVAAPPPGDATGAETAASTSVADRIILSTLQAQLREAESAYQEAATKIDEARAQAASADRRATELEGSAETAQAEIARLTETLDTVRADFDKSSAALRESEIQVGELKAELTAARDAATAAADETIAARAELAKVQADRDVERAAAASERTKAILAATEGLDEKSKLDVETAKAALENVWQDKLDLAVAEERRRWESKYTLLQTDYKELEPRYKAMMQQLEHKLANVEFDATMLQASKDKWKTDLSDERAKHKASRKSLKKARSEITSLTAKLDEAKQRQSDLETTLTTKDKGQVGAEASAAAAHQRENEVRLELQKRGFEVARLEEEKSTVQKTCAASEETCAALKETLSQSRAEHSEVTQQLINAEEDLAAATMKTHKLATQLKTRDEAIADLEATLKATMQHCDEQQRDIEKTQAEAASLAAIATSAALTLANTATTVANVCDAVDAKGSALTKLGVPALKVRTVKFSRPHGSEVGFELLYDEDNQNPGIRIAALNPNSPAASVAGALSVGDVLVAVNGELVLEATLGEVAEYIDRGGETVELSIVSADELDDDDSPFWQHGDAESPDALTSDGDVANGDAAGGGAAAAAAPSSESLRAAEPQPNALKKDASVVDSATEAVRRRTEALAERMATLQRVVTVMCTGVTATEHRVDGLTTKLSVSRRRASMLAEKLRVCSTDLDNTSAALASTVLDLEEKQVAISAAEHERETMDAAIQQLGTQLAEASTRATSNEIQATTARTLCDETQRAKAERDSEVERLTAALEEAVQSRNEAVEAAMAAEAAVDAARADLGQQEQDFSALNARFASLSTEKILASEGESAMSAELVNLTTTYSAEIETAQAAAADAKAKLQDMVDKATAVSQKLTATETRCKAAEVEVKGLKMEHTKVTEECERVTKALAAETEEREHLEAGLGEAINALALAQSDKVKVPILEKQIEAQTAEMQELRADGGDLRVKIELAARDIEAEKENVQFAQELLQQAGVDKASLEAELDEARKDAENVRILLRAAEQQQLNERRAADSNLHDHVAEVSTTRSKLRDIEAILASERSRVSELETLLAAGLLAKERLEAAVAAQHEQIRALMPPSDAAKLSAQPEVLAIGDGGVTDGTNAYRATSCIMRAFKVFGMITRHVILEVPRHGGLGLEVAKDEDTGYVTVSAIRPDGAAAKSTEINLGDCIVCVNGHFMLDQEYEAVIAAFTAHAAARHSLVLGSPDQMFEKEELTAMEDVDEATALDSGPAVGTALS